jgi:hypothetical protein
VARLGLARQKERIVKKSRLVISVLTTAAVLVAFLTFQYFTRHSMAQVTAFERGQPTATQRVLIATQGSPYKDRVVAHLVALLESRPVFVRVIDVSGLAQASDADWDAIIIIHTWEFQKPPAVVAGFVARVTDRDKLIGITTSGSGRERLPGVDVISSASIIDDMPSTIALIRSRLDALL